MKRKIVSLFLLLLMALSIGAITQKGYVRTITRPGHPSERLNGVLLRVRGNQNVVLSQQGGDFSILMQALKNGDPYVLSMVMKSGYQLAEQEVIGRQQAGSDRVPLEITMVSNAQLEAEKAAIAQKARASVEQRYTARVMDLQAALEKQTMTAEEMEKQMAALDDQLQKAQTQIEEFAERYARTDYEKLDSVAGAIQQAVEQGDMDAAERMIRQKGSFQDRQHRVEEMQKEANAQRQDLKTDYYHLHAIMLSRFLPDSAAYYLRLRADLDTLDAAAQLDYAKFLNEYQRNADEAWQYTQRAERQVRRTDGEHSWLWLRVLNEKGTYYNRMKRWSEAATTLEAAIDLATELKGADHRFVATRRTSLGGVYFNMGKPKDAKKQLTEALRIYQLPGQTDSIDEAYAYNGLGGVAYVEKDMAGARRNFEQAAQLLQRCAPKDPNLPSILGNLAAICQIAGDTEAAARYYREAYEASRRILGERHSATLRYKTKVESLP